MISTPSACIVADKEKVAKAVAVGIGTYFEKQEVPEKN